MVSFSDNARHLIAFPSTLENTKKLCDFHNINRCWIHKGSKLHIDLPKKMMNKTLEHNFKVSSKDIVTMCRLSDTFKDWHIVSTKRQINNGTIVLFNPKSLRVYTITNSGYVRRLDPNFGYGSCNRTVLNRQKNNQRLNYTLVEALKLISEDSYFNVAVDLPKDLLEFVNMGVSKEILKNFKII